MRTYLLFCVLMSSQCNNWGIIHISWDFFFRDSDIQNNSIFIYKKKFEDIKGVIRTRKSMKDRQSYCQKKKDKVTMIYKPLHRKVNIEEQNKDYKLIILESLDVNYLV
jgi:hypothetical protein